MTTATATPPIIDLLHHFGDVVLEVDRDGYILEAWIKQGYVNAERAMHFKGCKLSEIQPTKAPKAIEHAVKECIDTRRDKYYEVNEMTNGTPSKYIVRILALHEDKNKAYVVSENLGARYGAELVEDKWKMALDAAGDGMYDANQQTGEIYFSDKWHEIFGYNIGEITEDGKSWGTLIHPDDQEEVNRRWSDYMNGKKPFYSAEFRYRCKDGSYKWVLSRGVVVSWTPDGKPLRLIGTHKDINERKLNEMALQKALTNEKELSELKSKFISLASHEFRTPLSTVLSSAYLVSKYGNTDDQPKRDKHIHRIVSAVTTLTDILNDFLSVGRIEEGKIQARFADTNIKSVTKQVVTEIGAILKPGQHIFYEHADGEIACLDAALYKHIVINLLSNAIKFSPENAPIHIHTAITNEDYTLSVKDSGIGISDADKAHLFERFYRGTNVGNIQGTGLGLHIVSKYAELMYGTVECRSEISKGTEFIVRFKNKQV